MELHLMGRPEGGEAVHIPMCKAIIWFSSFGKNKNTPHHSLLRDHSSTYCFAAMQFFNQLMGNCARLTVHLRHNTLYTGNIIEGFLEVQVFQPVPFRAIRLRVCGKEFVHVERKVQEKDPHHHPKQGEPQRYITRTIIHENKQAVFNQLVTVSGSMKTKPIPYEGMLTVGTYYYPFAVQLPKNVPPSFSRRIGDDLAEIVYYVKAYMDVPMGRDTISRTPFRVIRAMPASQYANAAPFNFQQQYDVTCCCCIDKGKVGLKMYMNRTTIALDRDTLEVCCDIDNTLGKEPVESMTITLNNHVTFTAGGMSEGHTLCAGSQTLNNSVIPPGGTGRLVGVVQLDRTALPTVNTYNVKSTYSMVACINIPWATDPTQRIDVIVGQTVDDSNWSDVIPFNQPPSAPLPHHYHTVPETYYAPPPRPSFQFTPMPVASSVQYQQQVQYQFEVPPLGAPPQTWQATGVYVQGQQYQQQQSNANIVWQQGYAL